MELYKSLMTVLFVIFQGKLDISHNNAFQALSAPKKKYSQNDNIFSLCKGIPFYLFILTFHLMVFTGC
jgi:hypothetical protein